MPYRIRLALAVLLSCFMVQAYAQTYPTKPVTIVVPYAAGGATDISARIIGQVLSTELGQGFVIQNKPGVGGLLGIEQVARSTPDGYTLLVASTGPATISPLLFKERKFDPLERLDPIIMFASTPGVLLVRNGLAAKNVKELIALSRAKPGALNMSSSGVGSLQRLMGEFFQMKTGVKWTHIPFTGSAPMLNEMMAERVDVMVDLVASSVSLVKAGKIRALALTTPTRSSLLPDVPTLEELGHPGYNFSGWQALLGPKGTPPEVIARLNAILNKALNTPEMKERLGKIGAEAIGGEPQVLGKQMSNEIREWTEIIKAANIVVDQ